MPVTRPDVPYNGVPSVTTLSGSEGGGDYSNTRATPEAFGAGIGGAIEKAGETEVELANKQQGMINETLMTNADSQLAMKVGELKGQYLQNTGLAAQAAFPQYQADVETARQQIRATLPAMAAHGFDMLSERSVANHIADGSTYAAGQVRQANIDSGTNLTNVNVQAVLDPNVAANPQRVKDHQDSAIAGIQMGLDDDHPGLKVDPETGTKNFNESTPQGRALKANYDARVDNIITQVQTNRFDTLAQGDVLGAFGVYQQERDNFPRSTQVHLDSVFAPKVFNAHVDNGSTQVLADSEQEHAKLLYNPQQQPLSVRNNNPGNLRDSTTGQFRVFDTPEAGAAAMQSDLTAKINGNSPAMETNFGKNYSPTLSNVITTYAPANENNTKGYIDSVSKATGFSPNQVLTAADIPKLQVAMTKVESGGSGGSVGALPQKSYGTNENGGALTLADYYRTHSEDVLQRADAQAEKDMPGDLQYKRAMRETVSNYMSKTISNQSAQYTMDNKQIVRGITGELSKGQSPETEADLRSIPGMATLLDKVAAQDPKFAEGIPTMIAKNARRNDVSNGPNSFETISRVLQSQDELHPNHIKNQNQLDTLLGKTDSTGINMKDYNDAKPATELDNVIKEPLLKHMQEIAVANGNIDGKGQQRAVQWYNQQMAAYKQNQAMGDKKMDDATFASHIGEVNGPLYAPPTPSRMTQISNWAKEATGLGQVKMRTSDGALVMTPAGNVEKAIKAGYEKVE